MHLYSLTLQKASTITQAVHGNFSGTKQQEIVLSHGKSLEILRPDPNTGKLHSLHSCEVFGLVRSIIPFRLTGSSKGEFLLSVFWLLTFMCMTPTSLCCIQLSLAH